MKDIKDFPWLKVVRAALIALGVFVVALAIFSAGMMVGFRKAQFSFQWGDNYHRLFGGPRNGWLPPPPGGPGFRGDDYINANGVVGTVIKTDTTTLFIKGMDNVEKSVAISSGTLIRSGRSTLQLGDLKPDERAVILGVPSSTGQIEAKLIRVFNQ